MQDGYLINLTDDEGNSFNLEICGEVEYEDSTYVVFLPADMKEDDPDYGFIILKSVDDGSGEESYDSVDDDELLEKVYAIFMEQLEEDDGEAENEDENA